MEKDLVPFGKYKGQPMEVMKMDTQYCDWVAQQSWFKERYGNLYQVIINNFTEPTETPEHNKLQALFLDDNFCIGFLRAMRWRPMVDKQGYIDDLKQYYSRDDNSERCKELVELLSSNKLAVRLDKRFEEKGWDFAMEATIYVGSKIPTDSYEVAVEIKPNLSDDYPAVLRQIKNAKKICYHNALVIDTFDAQGASFEEVKKIFDSSGIKILTIKEIKEYSPGGV